MCGIVGYAGRKDQCSSVLITGLEALEYRGYDSAGVAITCDHQIHIVKAKGKVSHLKKRLNEQTSLIGTTGIAHTRWATHGEPSELNSHPHQSGMVTLVHNGIIENYNELKKELENAGYSFISQTDSEIAAAYIDYCYYLSNVKQVALKKAYMAFKGSFAFAILFEDEPDVIYAMRKTSPLVLGIRKDATFLASDITAFLTYTKQYVVLEHDEIARCSETGIQLSTLDGTLIERQAQHSTMDIQAIQKDGYEHFMLKEIHEEVEVVEKTISSFLSSSIKELISNMPNLEEYDMLHIVGCGSALYAGMIAKSLIETKARIHVDCTCASEYRYATPIYTKNTLVILVSQSGETADTMAALQLAKANNVATLAIVNVIGSSIAREADIFLYTKAGSEICVATTKAYCSQVALLSLLACNLAYIHGYLDEIEGQQIIKQLHALPKQMQQLIDSADYKSIAKKIYHHNDVFFIGRGVDYSLSMEGSLKLKEISYIHSEALPAGELKHGTISLIEQGTPIIALATDEDLYMKTISNIREVKARGAYVILIVSDDLEIANDFYDELVVVAKTDKLIQGILTIIPLQLLAYEIAKLRGCEIDQPRNLAKSVTVE